MRRRNKSDYTIRYYIPGQKKDRKPLIFGILGGIAVLVGAFFLIRSCSSRDREEPVVDETLYEGEATFEEVSPRRDSIPPLGFWTEDFRDEMGTIRNGETFSALMGRLGMSTGDAFTIANDYEEVFDVRKMRAGSHFQAYTDTTTNELKYVVYAIDRVRTAVFDADSLKIRIVSKETSTSRKFADVTITTSLWTDMQEAGASPLVILKLADVYAWTVDFFGLQENDRFRVLYSQTEGQNGEVFSVDTVYIAQFISGKKDLYAIRYDQGDGGNIYWSKDGESLKGAFLKAPLDFKRISSGFSYHRRHPVSGQVKPHTAVDYAAPTGTPVVAIGDGTVTSAGWTNGGGNTIRIRHNATYETSYMHLSKYASGIKNGAHVRQGQVIGYVGMTGTATGPHLDFRVYKNGTPINPLTLESPPTDPILKQNKPALDSVFKVYKAQLDSLCAQ